MKLSELDANVIVGALIIAISIMAHAVILSAAQLLVFSWYAQPPAIEFQLQEDSTVPKGEDT